MSRSRTSREFHSRMDDFPGIPGIPGNIIFLLYTFTIVSKHIHKHTSYMLHTNTLRKREVL